MPGLALVALGLLAAAMLHTMLAAMPLIVAALAVGVLIGNIGLATHEAQPGLAFASKPLLRAGIVLLGLRLSLGDVLALGVSTLAIVVATVSVTFFGVQWIGHRLGLSPGLSLLVASGFSICGNSAIASVSGATAVEDEEVAAAVGLVTLFGTVAVFVLPGIGGLVGLTDQQLGMWFGAGVQDTAQVIAVGAAAGPAVLAIATAVKLTRVLLLAPIVAVISFRSSRGKGGQDIAGERPALLPLFVAGFLVAMLVRSTGFIPNVIVEGARTVDTYFLAAGLVGLGTSVRWRELRTLGMRPLALGMAAGILVAGLSLVLVLLLG